MFGASLQSAKIALHLSTLLLSIFFNHQVQTTSIPRGNYIQTCAIFSELNLTEKFFSMTLLILTACFLAVLAASTAAYDDEHQEFGIYERVRYNH